MWCLHEPVSMHKMSDNPCKKHFSCALKRLILSPGDSAAAWGCLDEAAAAPRPAAEEDGGTSRSNTHASKSDARINASISARPFFYRYSHKPTDGAPVGQTVAPRRKTLYTKHLCPHPDAPAKTHLCFQKNIRMFFQKHNYDFSETYLCFSQNTPMIFQKHTFVFSETYL